MINWKVRIKSKAFWLAIIPATLLLVQTVAAVFGYTLDVDVLQGHLLDVVNAVFLVLAILGIVVDPTTAGYRDSSLAMTYTEPRVSIPDTVETLTVATARDEIAINYNEDAGR